MNFFKPRQPQAPLPAPESNNPPPPHLLLRQAFTNFQTHCSNFLNHSQAAPPTARNPPPHLFLQQALTNLQTHCSNFLNQHAPKFFDANPFSSPLVIEHPAWARIAEQHTRSRQPPASRSMSIEAIEERLTGVPVYALSNSSEQFVLVSGSNSSKALGLFCFKEEDAELLLERMRSMDPEMRKGAKVVAVALSKVFQLKVDGVTFRLIPDSSQIKFALKERAKAGLFDKSFAGVPVFQAKSLILRSKNKRYRPFFFRKEDIERTLVRASRDQNQLNPAFKDGEIQVCVLEDIIQAMKESSTSKWDDVVFIPPGIEVSTDPNRK